MLHCKWAAGYQYLPVLHLLPHKLFPPWFLQSIVRQPGRELHQTVKQACMVSHGMSGLILC